MVARTTDGEGPITTQDGTPLKVSLARALRREKLRALALIAPLLVFILFSFVIPIADMMLRSVDNAIVPTTLPATVKALATWDAAGDALPGEAVYAALHRDLTSAVARKSTPSLAAV